MTSNQAVPLGHGALAEPSHWEGALVVAIAKQVLGFGFCYRCTQDATDASLS